MLLGGASASAQEPRAIFHLPLRLMDLSLAADTLSGVQILMQPSMRSKQGKESEGLIWLRFHPDTVLEWINGAALALRVPAPNAQSDGIQWSRALLPRGGNGAVAVGRERKRGKLQKGHWLAIADSTDGWRAERNGAEADSLLKLLLRGEPVSIDTTDTAAPSLRDRRTCSVIHQPTPRSIHNRAGRVV